MEEKKNIEKELKEKENKSEQNERNSRKERGQHFTVVADVCWQEILQETFSIVAFWGGSKKANTELPVHTLETGNSEQL